MTLVFSGIDSSLEHGCIVSIQRDDIPEDPIISVAFYCATKKYAKLLGGELIEARKDDEHPVAYSITRRQEIYSFVVETLDRQRHGSTHVALEGYAYESKYQAHQIGEGGGTVRDALWSSGLPFSVYDPKTVKMFATGKGNASKEEMIEVFRDEMEWQGYEKEWETSLTNKKPSLELSTALASRHLLSSLTSTLPQRLIEDIADAYFVARMCETEYHLRSGTRLLSSLPEHQIRAFNRVSDVDDQNILARPWIQNSA